MAGRLRRALRRLLDGTPVMPLDRVADPMDRPRRAETWGRIDDLIVKVTLQGSRRPQDAPPLPEDAFDWSQRYEGRCQLYPGRDCPGCRVRCARIGALL